MTRKSQRKAARRFAQQPFSFTGTARAQVVVRLSEAATARLSLAKQGPLISFAIGHRQRIEMAITARQSAREYGHYLP